MGGRDMVKLALAAATGFLIAILALYSEPPHPSHINWWIPAVFIAGFTLGRLVTPNENSR